MKATKYQVVFGRQVIYIPENGLSRKNPKNITANANIVVLDIRRFLKST